VCVEKPEVTTRSSPALPLAGLEGGAAMKGLQLKKASLVSLLVGFGVIVVFITTAVAYLVYQIVRTPTPTPQ